MYKILLAIVCVAVFVGMASAVFPATTDSYLAGYPQKNPATNGATPKPQYFFPTTSKTEFIEHKTQLVTAFIPATVTATSVTQANRPRSQPNQDHKAPLIGFVVDYVVRTETVTETIDALSVFVSTDSSLSTSVFKCNLYVGDACFSTTNFAAGPQRTDFSDADSTTSNIEPGTTPAATASNGAGITPNTQQKATGATAHAHPTAGLPRVFQWINYTLTTPYVAGSSCGVTDNIVVFATVLCFDTSVTNTGTDSTTYPNPYVPTYLEFDEYFNAVSGTGAGTTPTKGTTVITGKGTDDKLSGFVNINNDRFQTFKDGSTDPTNHPHAEYTDTVYYQAYGTQATD